MVLYGKAILSLVTILAIARRHAYKNLSISYTPTRNCCFRPGCFRLSGGSEHRLMSSIDQSKQDAQERNDEIEALQAIFTDEFRQINDDSFEIQIDKDLCIRVCLPSNYPSTCPPLFELQNGLLTDEQVNQILTT
jgi:hypothetical protein